MNPQDIIDALENLMRGTPVAGTYIPGTNPLDIFAGK